MAFTENMGSSSLTYIYKKNLYRSGIVYLEEFLEKALWVWWILYGKLVDNILSFVPAYCLKISNIVFLGVQLFIFF